MGGPSKQETEFTKRIPTNKSVGQRTIQNFVLKTSLTHTWYNSEVNIHTFQIMFHNQTPPPNNQENNNFDPFSKFNCAKY